MHAPRPMQVKAQHIPRTKSKSILNLSPRRNQSYNTGTNSVLQYHTQHFSHFHQVCDDMKSAMPFSVSSKSRNIPDQRCVTMFSSLPETVRDGAIMNFPDFKLWTFILKSKYGSVRTGGAYVHLAANVGWCILTEQPSFPCQLTLNLYPYLC